MAIKKPGFKKKAPKIGGLTGSMLGGGGGGMLGGMTKLGMGSKIKNALKPAAAEAKAKPKYTKRLKPIKRARPNGNFSSVSNPFGARKGKTQIPRLPAIGVGNTPIAKSAKPTPIKDKKMKGMM